MKIKEYKPEEIVKILRQIESFLAGRGGVRTLARGASGQRRGTCASASACGSRSGVGAPSALANNALKSGANHRQVRGMGLLWFEFPLL